MATETTERVNFLTKLYEIQIAHLRHHETMRAQSTNYIVLISIALLGIIPAQAFADTLGPSSIFIGAISVVLLNVFGALLSWEHFERSDLHARTAAAYREQASHLLQSAETFEPTMIRQNAHQAHYSRYKLLGKLKLYWLWIWLHALLAVLGVIAGLLNLPK